MYDIMYNISVKEKNEMNMKNEYETYKDLFNDLDDKIPSVFKKIESRREYLEIRKQYIDTFQHSSNLFDNTMITLSVSSLGGLLYFLQNHGGNVMHKEYILWAGIILSINIFITLISFYISEEANLHELISYENNYKGNIDYKVLCKKEVLNSILVKIKIISIILLPIGISLIMWFLFVNIK